MSPTKLDPGTVGELDRMLQSALVRLRESLQAVVEEGRTTRSSGRGDESAQATETLHAEMRVALMGRRTEQALQIQDALERLSQGQYGFCQECGHFIGAARLRALPFAQRCRECQDRAERRSRREAAAVAVPRLPRDREAA